MSELNGTVRAILILAAAILVALVVWNLVAFAISIAAKVLEIAALVVVLYVLYLIARAAVRKRTT